MKKLLTLIIVFTAASLLAIREDSPSTRALSHTPSITTACAGETDLHWAAMADLLKEAQLLINKGANINAQAADGKTPLHKAACYGQITAVARLLLSKGAHMNIQDTAGRTAYDYACARGNRPLIQLFIEHNDPRMIWHFGPTLITEKTPLSAQQDAPENLPTSVEKFFLAQGNDDDFVDIHTGKIVKHQAPESLHESSSKRVCC
jgi:hypothetical protein